MLCFCLEPKQGAGFVFHTKQKICFGTCQYMLNSGFHRQNKLSSSFSLCLALFLCLSLWLLMCTVRPLTRKHSFAAPLCWAYFWHPTRCFAKEKKNCRREISSQEHMQLKEKIRFNFCFTFPGTGGLIQANNSPAFWGLLLWEFQCVFLLFPAKSEQRTSNLFDVVKQPPVLVLCNTTLQDLNVLFCSAGPCDVWVLVWTKLWIEESLQKNHKHRNILLEWPEQEICCLPLSSALLWLKWNWASCFWVCACFCTKSLCKSSVSPGEVWVIDLQHLLFRQGSVPHPHLIHHRWHIPWVASKNHCHCKDMRNSLFWGACSVQDVGRKGSDPYTPQKKGHCFAFSAENCIFVKKKRW